MNQLAFNLDASRTAKASGMGLAAINRESLLSLARKVAVQIAKANGGTCNMDQVSLALIGKGIDPRCLGNAAGSVFKTKDWIFTGERIQSAKVSSHAREVKVWRLF